MSLQVGSRVRAQKGKPYNCVGGVGTIQEVDGSRKQRFPYVVQFDENDEYGDWVYAKHELEEITE